MALVTVTLPVVNNLPVGVLNCYVIYDSAILDSITFPTSVKFLDIKDIIESIDAEAGLTEYENVDIEVAEDYTTHTEGFWHRLINAFPAMDFELMFTLTEGSDETFLFRGKIYRKNIRETEHYLDQLISAPSVVVRGVEFKLTSSLKVLEEITVVELCNEVLMHDFLADRGGSGENIEFVTFAAVFASMIKLAYGESYDTSLIVNNSTDIQMYNGITTSYESFLVNAISMKRYFSTDALLIDGDYTSCTASYVYMFSNAYELLKHLCKQFAVIPKYSFGTTAGLIDATPANNHHRITLESRGRSSGTAITMTGKLLDSVFCSDTPRKSKRIRVSMNNWQALTDESMWYVDNVIHGGETPSYYASEFDIDIPVDFVLKAPDAVPHWINAIHYIHSGTSCSPVVQGRYWDYPTGAYIVITYIPFSESPEPLITCLVLYLFARMGDGRVQYERTYGGIKANNGTTNSQRNCKTTMRTTISDGVISRNFYATEVRKNILTNKAKIVWVQE